MSYYIRSKYLDAYYCGLVNEDVQSDKEHGEFTKCIQT